MYVCVCTYLSDIHCFSITVSYVPCCMFILYVRLCVCVCVCKCGIYFDIVSQKSISLDFIPSTPPPYFLPTICVLILLFYAIIAVIIEHIAIARESRELCCALLNMAFLVCDMPMSGNVTDVGNLHGFYCT